MRQPAHRQQPPVTGRGLRWTTALAMAAGVGLLSVATAIADREPVPLWSVPAGLVLAGFGSAAVIQSPRYSKWLLIGLAVGGGAWAVTSVLAGSALLAIIGCPVAAVVVLFGQALAMLVARSSHTPGALTSLRTIGAVALALTALPLTYALLARHATVTVDHAHTGAINDHTPAFDGIALGDTVADVELVMGPAPRWTGDQNIGPLASDSVYDGPTSLDYGQPPRDRFLRYPGASFAIHDGHVRWIQIDDQSAATAAGLGPGDSISLVKRFYPTARCAQDSIYSEGGSLPYPYCQQRLAPHRWLTFFGTYRQAGTPITSVWLTTSRLEMSKPSQGRDSKRIRGPAAPRTTYRPQALTALSSYAAILAGVAIVLGTADRIPHWWLLLAAAFLAVHMTAGRILGGRSLALPLLLIIELIAIAAIRHNPFIVAWVMPILAAAGFAATLLGVKSRRRASTTDR